MCLPLNRLKQVKYCTLYSGVVASLLMDRGNTGELQDCRLRLLSLKMSLGITICVM